MLLRSVRTRAHSHLIMGTNFDVIYELDFYFYFSCILSLAVSFCYRKKFIVHMHSTQACDKNGYCYTHTLIASIKWNRSLTYCCLFVMHFFVSVVSLDRCVTQWHCFAVCSPFSLTMTVLMIATIHYNCNKYIYISLLPLKQTK